MLLKALFLSMFLLVACAHNDHSHDRVSNLKKWADSLENTGEPGPMPSLYNLKSIYLGAIDGDDFLEEFLKLKPANCLRTEEDYRQLTNLLVYFKNHVSEKNHDPKSKPVVVILDLITDKLREVSQNKFSSKVSLNHLSH